MIDSAHIENVLDDVYLWCKKENFKGFNKHDGLNSPLLKALLGWGKWPRLIAIQSVMRSPINIRPLLGVRKTYNPKGLALLSMGLIDRYRSNKNSEHLSQAQQLLSLLLTIRSPGKWSGPCWGYHYPWQDLGFFSPSNTPNAVVSCFVCEAFISAYRETGEKTYIDTVGQAIHFFLNDLTVLKNNDEELCLGYMPLPMTMRVMDVSILIGAVIAQYIELTGDRTHAHAAEKLTRYVVQQQTDDAAWFYTDPPEDSLIRHDNYHTGFILDALERYMAATGNRQWQPQYDKGLKFYAEKLFNEDGSPRWMSDCDYPHDIHGAAQGLLTLSRHLDKYRHISERIMQWSMQRMYHSAGRFYYQETPYFRKRFTLLRWCNAWMFRGLSSYQRLRRHANL